MRRQPRYGRHEVGRGFQEGGRGVESGHGGFGEEGRSRSSVVVERIGRVWSEGVFVMERMFGEVVADGNFGVV